MNGYDTDGLIDSFSGPHEFLSNFYPSPIYTLDGQVYRTAEHAFQTCKTADETWRARIRGATGPGVAKRWGRSCPLRPNWEEVKLDAMTAVLRLKFTTNPLLRVSLLRTMDAQLIEGNTWGDTYWGTVDGVGQNHLGRLLMLLRSRLHTEAHDETRSGLSTDEWRL